MQVNGYQIREAIRYWVLVKDTVAKQFKESLFAFVDDKKLNPLELSEQFKEADINIAILEELQQKYNLTITIEVQNETMTLARAVKLVGGAGRLEKMWRSAATDTGQDKYSHREKTRDKDTIVAQRQVSVEQCIKTAKTSSARAGALRAAIAEANTNTIVLGENDFDFDPALFQE